MSLPRYSILPQSRYNKILQKVSVAEKVVTSGDTSDIAIRELIAQNSGIRAVESEITYYAERFAYYNKCRMAADYLSKAISKIEEKIANEILHSQEIQDNLGAQRDDIRKQLVKQLEEKKERIISEAEKNAANELANKDKAKDDLQQQIDKDIEKLCKQHKKDKSVDRLKREISEKLNQNAIKYRRSIQEQSWTYWVEQGSQLVEKLIQVVNTNRDIPEQERETLKKIIREYPNEPPKIEFDIHKSQLIRDKKILWFKIGEKIVDKKCKEIASENFNKDCRAVTDYFRKEYLKSFKTHSDNLIKEVTGKLDEFNDNLRDLKLRLDESREKISTLKKRKEHLENANDNIQNMLSCQEDKQ